MGIIFSVHILNDTIESVMSRSCFSFSASCMNAEDLNTMCSMIEKRDPNHLMIRKNAKVTCPFQGSRSFTYQMPGGGGCTHEHSRLVSRQNTTELVFLYNMCSDPATSRVKPHGE